MACSVLLDLGWSATNRSGHRSFDRPSASKAILKAAVGDANISRPVLLAHAQTLVLNHSRVSAVSGLRSHCCPSAVARLVIAIIIYAVNAVLWSGPTPHISKEVLETSPSFTHFYAASGVEKVVRTGGAVAPSTHSAPDAVLGRFLGFAVLGADAAECGSRKFSLQASATASSTAQRCHIDNTVFPAITPAKPHRTPVATTGWFNRNKPSKPLSGVVLERGPIKKTCPIPLVLIHTMNCIS